MTGARGPKSKSNAIRRNAPKASTNLEAPKADAPAFPLSLVASLPATIAWWDAWVESPQAERFAATDWQRLVMLAPLVQMYFEAPSPQLMAEIRQNEAKLGATAADRDRLGWKIEAPPAQDDKPKRETKPDPRKSKQP